MASKELEMVLGMMKLRVAKPGMTFQERRAEMEALPGFPLAKDVKCKRVDAGGVPAEWITVPGVKNDRVIYFFHGGGYALGSVNTHREWISRLSRSAGARVLAPEYRLAPEHPFPCAIEDAVTGYRWLLSEGVAPSRIVIAGSSAGGGLTVAALLALRDAGEKLPAAGVCISPWVNLECNCKSIANDKVDDRISLENLMTMAKAYLGEADPRTPLASPIYADLHGLPPLLIQAGTAEGLLDDARRLAECAEAAGVKVTFETWQDMIHVWHSFAAVLPEAQQAIERIGEFVKERVK